MGLIFKLSLLFTLVVLTELTQVVNGQATHLCSHGDVRLVNGTEPSEGRVDVCYSGTWYSACDDHWTINEARVVCRQLGYCSYAGVVYDVYRNGTGSYKYIMCVGTEQYLSNCSIVNHSGCRDSDGDAVGVRCRRDVSRPLQITTLDAISSTKLQITWYQPNDIYYRDIYNIECHRLPSGSTVINYTVDRPTTTYTASGLYLTSYDHECCVTSSDDCGNRYRSCASIPFPSPPRSVTAERSVSSIEISWTPPSNAYIITAYNVYTRRNYFSISTTTRVSASSNSVVVSSLQPSTTYYFYVRAINVAGEGTQSSTVIRTTLSGIPSRPLQLRFTDVGSTSVELSWELPVTTYGLPYNYYLTCSPTSPYPYYPQHTSGGLHQNTLSHIFRGLHPGINYSCCVVTRNTYGQSGSACTTIYTPDAEPAAAPGNIQVTSTSPTELVTIWDPPPLEQRNGAITKYKVQICNVTYRQQDCVEYSTSHDVHSLPANLHPHYSYTLTVTAYTVGYGPTSEPISFQMPEDVPSASPRNISHDVLSSSKVKLWWDPPPIDEQNGVITAYPVRILTEDGQTLSILYAVTTTLTVNSLQQYTTYVVQVAASTKVGVGPFYRHETVTTALGLNFGLCLLAGMIVITATMVIIMVIVCFRKTWKKCLKKAKIKFDRTSKEDQIDTELDSGHHPPEVPERCYLDDPDFVDEHLKAFKEPEIPERCSINLASNHATGESLLKEVEALQSIKNGDGAHSTLTDDNVEKIYQPLLPPRLYEGDQDRNEPSDYQSLKFVNRANIPPHALETGRENTYQPLIPPKPGRKHESSREYQSVVLSKRASESHKPVDQPDKDLELQLTNHSEGHYQTLVIQKQEETSLYQPLTFHRNIKPCNDQLSQSRESNHSRRV